MDLLLLADRGAVVPARVAYCT